MLRLSRLFSKKAPLHNGFRRVNKFKSCVQFKNQTRPVISIKNLFFYTPGELENMKKWTKEFNTIQANSWLGDWEQFDFKSDKGNCRVCFQTYRILVGNFDPTLDVDTAYNLGRLTDPGSTCDPWEKLDSHVEALEKTPENDTLKNTFLSQYFNNGSNPFSSDEPILPALEDAEVLKIMSNFSDSVCGVSILSGHTGVLLEYTWDNITKEKLNRDIESAVNLYWIVQKYGNTSNDDDE
eukprot:TRINITY_DN5409_c0_g1_i1.p1 TRINITY_DN5409_c0_g1~~TRINITY_DN5409_c0_g1_i1.p1  ORF type:complete len:238 (+),score=30.89 TRINITY_DN5409_c0_g1_i1:25-738(+)